jgi:hypothetical protein
MANMSSTSNKWSAEDRQRFADRNFLKAQTIPNKKAQARKRACRGQRGRGHAD